MLENEFLTWRLEQDGASLRSTALANKRTGSTFEFGEAEELALVFSARTDRVSDPSARVADFVVESADATPVRFVARLCSASAPVEATLHYELDGPVRRKWAEVRNTGDEPRLLLDIQLDGFHTTASAEGGGDGQPLFLDGEAWMAVEYPSGENVCREGRVTLAHFPGRLLQPGDTYTSHVALVSMTEAGRAVQGFTDYIQSRAIRKAEALSIYTPFGINNQWGPCSTLTDEQTLDVLGELERWRARGVCFDYFTLDTGWVDPGSDLTRFRPNCYPDGPGEVVDRVRSLGMDFGLWFATSWGAESCWDYPPAAEGQAAPAMPWLNGVPAKAHCTDMFCYACEAYAKTVHEAVIHHVRTNHARFIKFDGGNYRCDAPDHDHLPGRYSTERMFDSLGSLAEAVRREAPDTFVMWYWGLRSPFWALHGDSIFESGLHMEGSGTSSVPTLYYRDSVTLAQDQNAQHARTIPPLVKDSLGVWLADTRWGNFMGKERWREAMVMDLGRGSLLFPNIWGDVYLLDEDDVEFLAWISQLAKEREDAFGRRHDILGDPWQNGVYGYAHISHDRGFVFINNVHFAARRVALPLNDGIGLSGQPGTQLDVVSHFPERATVSREDGSPHVIGDTCNLWLRPFEVLMLEVSPATGAPTNLPPREVASAYAEGLGRRLDLAETSPDPSLGVRFVREQSFRDQEFVPKVEAFETTLPDLSGPQPVLAVPIRLRDGDAEWRGLSVVAEAVQARLRIGNRDVILTPTPDARQFGNTQKAGCSWVTYQVRLSPSWSGKPVRLEVSTWLPAGVEALTEAWVVKRWWEADTRPAADGYYGDAPS